jgi:hypothetical protein
LSVGKGFSGTFALVDGSPKTGAKFEDAIESAIIAMNEPKDASVTAIRDYLGRFEIMLTYDNNTGTGTVFALKHCTGTVTSTLSGGKRGKMFEQYTLTSVSDPQ